MITATSSAPQSRWPASLQRVVGAAIFFWFVGMWIWAFVSPLAWLVLMIARKYVTATTLLVVAATPYFVKVRPYAWCRAVLRHSRHYFECCEIYAPPAAAHDDGDADSEASSSSSSDPRKPFLLCVAPHGVFCIGYVQLAIDESFSDVRFLMARVLYSAPFFNFFMLRLAGTFGCATADEMRCRMEAGENLALVPGGFHEATLHSHEVDRVYLKTRKGFVKYALRYGYDLIPVWCDGESATYRNVWQGAWNLRLMLNDWHVPGVVPFGAWFCPILPSPKAQLRITVGDTIKLPEIPNPSDADISYWHQQYVQAMLKLQANGAAKKLEMW